MCGIAGICSQSKSIDEEKFRKALGCLRHRGPEGEGFWLDQQIPVALGHRRLRIIDLSAQAAQPMDYGNRYRIVHNGELYNYIELRQELEKSGSSFFTHSDTEVIVAAYAAWGRDCLQKFDGMFAFAIWDETEKKLFAARDRFGEKPFFYYYDPERFVFSSEQKTLWQLGVPKEVNGSMLYNFLSIGYTTNPGDPQETFYQQVRKLPAASFIEYSFAGHRLVVEKYWQLQPEPDQNIQPEEAIHHFRQLFTSSIQKRLRSDVSVGTSLSGGLDSSAIVAFCDTVASGQYSHKCFTAHFEGFEKDELAHASLIAKKFGLEHHVVSIRENEVVDLMETVMNYQEEPFGSASVLAQYRVYQAAKENGVTVLLDGQGADEVLAGYHRYYKWFWQEYYRHKKLGKSGELEKAKALGIEENFSLKNKLAALLPQFASGLMEGRKAKQAYRHQDLDRSFAFAHKRSFYYTMPASFDLNGALFFNTCVNGLEELLRLADRNSMAHATEVRLPFLQHNLVEFLFTLPASFKIHEGWTKWLLRKSVEDKLPETITWRRDKVGFEPPQKAWMQDAAVQEAIKAGKKKLVGHQILQAAVMKKNEPHSSYAAHARDWKYWSASYLFD